jgi:hypothetical protein
MLEKLGTRDVQSMAELFTVVNKCAKGVEARAWHQPCPDQAKVGGIGPSSEKAKKHNLVVLPKAQPRVAHQSRRHPKGQWQAEDVRGLH